MFMSTRTVKSWENGLVIQAWFSVVNKQKVIIKQYQCSCTFVVIKEKFGYFYDNRFVMNKRFSDFYIQKFLSN